jgi:hypothetical protein
MNNDRFGWVRTEVGVLSLSAQALQTFLRPLPHLACGALARQCSVVQCRDYSARGIMAGRALMRDRVASAPSMDTAVCRMFSQEAKRRM